MSSFLKGLLHTVIGLLVTAAAQAILHSIVADVTIGGVVTWALQWYVSHSIPTTTGASAQQG